MTDADLVRQFFLALFTSWPASIFAELRVFKNGKPSQFWVRSVSELLQRATSLSATHEVFFGANQRRGRRGKKEDVALVVTLHVDIDRPFAEANADLASFPVPPSAIVASGWGLHAYWFLREPFAIESTADIERIESLNRGLTHVLGGDEGTWDISRVLRVPGTVSHKRGGALVELRGLYPERRYDPSDLEEWGLDAPHAAPASFSNDEQDGDAALAKAEAADLPAKTWRLITGGHPDGSDRSKGDFAACCDLVRSGLSDDEIRAIFRQYPIGSKYGEPGHGDRYLALTIGKVRGAAGDDEAPRSERGKELLEALEQARRVVAKWLLLDDQRVVEVVLAVPVANAAPGDPVWLLIVAASSGAKTELIRGLSLCPQVYALSSLTDRTFASGFGDPKQNSLLHRVKTGQTLTFKDFGSVLSMRPDQKAEILGQLREIYDGRYRKAFGTGRELDWEGRLGFLTGSTPAIERHHAVIGELGERFLWYRLLTPDSDREAIADLALEDTGHEEQMRAEIAEAFLDVISRVDPEEVAAVTCDADAAKRIGAAANLATWLRTPVVRDYRDKTIDYQPLPEGPARMAKALLRLGKALAAIRGEQVIDEEALSLLVKIALDSVPPKRLAAVRCLAAADGWVRSRKVALKLRLPTTSATYLLEDLALLDVIEKRVERKQDVDGENPEGGSQFEDDGSGRSFEWRFRELLADLLARLEVPGEASE